MLRKYFPEDEKESEDFITGTNLEYEELVGIYHQKTHTWYGLIQLRNSHPRVTLENGYLIYMEMDAGTPKEHECLQYQFITRQEAEKLFFKPKNYEYTVKDFKKFPMKKKAKLLERRSKKNLYLSPPISNPKKKGLEDRYGIDQKIELGDMPPLSDKFIVLKTRGGHSHPSIRGNLEFGGDSRPIKK